MRLCRCFFRLGLQWTYGTRLKLIQLCSSVTCSILCAVFTTFMAKEGQKIFSTHRQCMIICLEQLNHWCTEGMFYGVSMGHVFPKIWTGNTTVS